MSEDLGKGLGRRKTSVARVYLRSGNGKVTVNGKAPLDYFANPLLVQLMEKPLSVTNSAEKYDFVINVIGGGTTGQAGAAAMGIARALCEADESNRKVLRANGLLTRDNRMVERKKYGQKGARRSFQFSKR